MSDVAIVTASLSTAGAGVFEVVRQTARRLTTCGVSPTVYGLVDEDGKRSDAIEGVKTKVYSVTGLRRFGAAETSDGAGGADNLSITACSAWRKVDITG